LLDTGEKKKVRKGANSCDIIGGQTRVTSISRRERKDRAIEKFGFSSNALNGGTEGGKIVKSHLLNMRSNVGEKASCRVKNS